MLPNFNNYSHQSRTQKIKVFLQEKCLLYSEKEIILYCLNKITSEFFFEEYIPIALNKVVRSRGRP
jgi:hypothetical protein